MTGRMDRSRPTMAPTNTFTTTSSVNCFQFARRPSAMVPTAFATLDCVCRGTSTLARCAESMASFARHRRAKIRRPRRGGVGGGGGMSRNIAATNEASSSIANVLLNRRSNPMVDMGSPLNARPQTDPANAPGRICRWSEGSSVAARSGIGHGLRPRRLWRARYAPCRRP